MPYIPRHLHNSSTSRKKLITYPIDVFDSIIKCSYSKELKFNVEEFKNPFIILVNKLLSKRDLCNVRYIIYYTHTALYKR